MYLHYIYYSISIGIIIFILLNRYRQFWDVSLICASMDDVEIDSNATTDADLFDNIRQV